MDQELKFWTWVFFFLYTGIMLVCGVVGMRRVRGSDDYATARGGYGPLYLALAMTATTASGATFLGVPGICYTYGLSGLWLAFVYPVGVYGGVLLCMRVVGRAGETMGSRSIPEFLGDRYQSEVIRVVVSVFSLILLFYIAGQLISGTVMFQTMMGITKIWAMGITMAILVAYVSFGGAHADILTDGIQGAVMLVLAVAVGVLFLWGYSVEGGLAGIVETIGDSDPRMVKVLNEASPVVGSWWAVLAILISHLPLGMLPHIGNKLWALEDSASRKRFIVLAFLFGMLLPVIALGGIHCRAIVGNGLTDQNHAIPVLFAHMFPPWLAALAGAGILAAVMSTADGLVISTSQVFANDLYRRTLVPRWQPDASEGRIDRIALHISRVATVVVLLAAFGLAWIFVNRNVNIALLVWIGVGAMMASLAGPLVLGVLWQGVTTRGALAGFLAGAAAFVYLKLGLVGAFAGGFYELPDGTVIHWLLNQKENPFSCAALGEIFSVAVTVIVSCCTPKLPAAHLSTIFGERH